MKLRAVALVAIVMVMGGLGWGEQTTTSAPSPMERYLAAQQSVEKFFKDREYQKAADACEQMLKQVPGDPNTWYNLACAHARLNKLDEAIKDLETAVKKGLMIAEKMEKDEDLEAVRGHKRFAELVKQAKVNARAGGKYEPGAQIEGVKTVEAFPEEGLRYRLRIPPDATEQKPAKLIVWLHPSGGSMNSAVEKLSPELAKHGYALMVMTQKQFMGWNSIEMDALVNKTFADVRTHKEIDAARPVLLGYSAGGQVAIQLWAIKPDAWGGLILDAAYPVQIKEGKYAAMALPENKEALKKAPIYAVVGGNDGGSKVWAKVKDPWIEAGVPLKVMVVPEKGHAWLLTGEVLKGAYEWLDEVKAGKLPMEAKEAEGKFE